MKISDQLLHMRLEKFARIENRIIAIVVKHVAEADRRQLYLRRGFSSLFQYLMSLGYSNAPAQARIDAARLHNQVPVVDCLSTGELNLSQLSILAQGLRRKNVSVKVKKEILERIKGQDIRTTHVLVCQLLELEPIRTEKKSVQADGSVRVEMTFSKEQWEKFEKVKQVLSHSQPSPQIVDVVETLSTFFLNRKDPGRASKGKPENIRRKTFQKHECCQFLLPNGSKCGSKFQLQVDHIIPKWAGGTDDPDNLQILCAAHNKFKYQKEGGARWAPRGC